MLLLRAGMVLAAAAALFSAVASAFAGYPVEVAILRGLVAWGGVAFIAFVAELVVATTPPPPGMQLERSTFERDATDGDGEVKAA